MCQCFANNSSFLPNVAGRLPKEEREPPVGLDFLLSFLNRFYPIFVIASLCCMFMIALKESVSSFHQISSSAFLAWFMCH
jgi:hypothetical protein